MGRRVVSEVVTMKPKPLVEAIAAACNRPYYRAFNILQTRVEIRGDVVALAPKWRKEWIVRKDGVTTHGHA